MPTQEEVIAVIDSYVKQNGKRAISANGLNAIFKSMVALTSMAGSDGKSAYAIAVANGFVGTEDEWLLSLEGKADQIEVGTVSTLPAGTPATVVLRPGTGNVKFLDVGIPKGDTGDSGSEQVSYQGLPYSPIITIAYDKDTRNKSIAPLEGDISILVTGMTDTDPAGQIMLQRGDDGQETINLNGQLKGVYSTGANSTMILYYEYIGDNLIFTIY